jgi:integrase
MQTNLLTAKQIADVFQVSERTVATLAQNGFMPCKRRPASAGGMAFSMADVARWLERGPDLSGQAPDVGRLRQECAALYPDALKALRSLDRQIAPRRFASSCYLSKVVNSRLGFVYYARYRENGKTVPSRWSTGTNNEKLATAFAEQNRERLLSLYHKKRRSEADFFGRMARYYEAGSSLLQNDVRRGRRVSEHRRKQHLSTVAAHWIPFLKKNGVQSFADTTPAVIARFQNKLLAKGLAPQTVNRHISALSAMFAQFSLLGIAPSNPFKQVSSIKGAIEASIARGCHDIDRMPGVFEEPWADATELLLCLVVYTTGMRNSEIRRAVVGDVIERNGVSFISITKSKTASGSRLAPLHPFVLSKLDLSRPPEAPLIPLPRHCDALFSGANRTLGQKLGFTAEQLRAERVTFYSGRHFYKTMLNAEGLGDAEEYFMGHRVSGDVAKLYNHRDRQGQKKLAEKALEAIAIMDRRLFACR